MDNKEMEIREGDKIYFKNHPTIIVGMRQANGMKVKNLEKKYGKIEKIQRAPVYATIYKHKEILDDAEKRYLKAVIRPYKGQINCIKKTSGFRGEYIDIVLTNNEDIALPYFEHNTMYKGMDIDKEYTVKELGLYE